MTSARRRTAAAGGKSPAHLQLRVRFHPDCRERVLDGLEAIRVIDSLDRDAAAGREDAVLARALQLHPSEGGKPRCVTLDE